MCSCDWGKIYGKDDQRYLGLKKMINGDSMGISWNRRILYNSMFLNFTITDSRHPGAEVPEGDATIVISDDLPRKELPRWLW